MVSQENLPLPEILSLVPFFKLAELFAQRGNHPPRLQLQELSPAQRHDSPGGGLWAGQGLYPPWGDRQPFQHCQVQEEVSAAKPPNKGHLGSLMPCE